MCGYLPAQYRWVQARSAKMQDMNWDDLRFFLAAARSRTLSGAARRLGVNQTTVTRRLEALEAELGVRLFDRTPGGIIATQAGAEILRVAEQVEDNVAALERQALGLDARLTGELRVTTLDMTAFYEAGLFDGFARRHPGIELELSVGNFPRNLTRREADVAIRWTDAPPEHLVGHRVARAEYALYGANSLLETLPAEVGLADYPWLGWDMTSNARVTWAWMQQNIPEANIVCRFDMALAMHAAIKAGMGVGFMPCAYADGDPTLRRLRPVEPGFGIDIWVLTHPDLRGSARVRAFLDHASSHFETKRELFAGRGSTGVSGGQGVSAGRTHQSSNLDPDLH
jgi:DNA-binding transcriptional LysR family regulator